MVLSHEAVLVYILAVSGVKGHLTSGRIERDPSGKLNVFDSRGDPFDYLSGDRLSSWCVLGPEGKTVDGWQDILPKDLAALAK